MNKCIVFLFVSLLLITSCDPDNNKEDVFETPEFILGDLNGKYEGFDTVIFNDDSHVMLISHYANKVVREYLVIHEGDTLAVFYSPKGIPEYITNGHKHIVVGNRSEQSLHVEVIDDTGDCEIYDWKTPTNWVEYETAINDAISKDATSSNVVSGEVITSDSSYDHRLNKQVELLQSTIYGELESFLVDVVSGNSYNPTSGLLLWAGTAIAYAISDDPVWFVTVKQSNEIIGQTMLTFKLYNVLMANPEAALLLGIGLVYMYDGALIAEGIENGDFRLPFAKDPELFAKEIKGGLWWAGPNSAQFDWQAQQINAPIKVGLAYFDYTDPDRMEIGVKKGITLPKGWTADVVPDGRDFCLVLSISENDKKGEIITFDIPVYVTGVSNIEEDLVYSVKQTPRIMLGSESVYFDNLSPVTVDITNYSRELGDISYSPGWLDADVNQTANGIITGLTLTPKILDGANDDKVVIAITSEDGQGHYSVELPVFPYNKEKAELEAIRKKLVKFYYDTGGPTTWYNRDNWCSDKPLEEWYGVVKTETGWMLWLDKNGLVGHGDLSGWDTLEEASFQGKDSDYWNGESSSHLKSIDLSGCSALKRLWCDDNDIEKINISGCTALKYILCRRNCLKHLPDISEASSLSSFECNNNLIEDLVISDHPSLRAFFGDENPFKSPIRINNCPRLFWLRINSHSGSANTVDISNCPSLTDWQYLVYDGLPLETLRIRNCTALTGCSLPSTLKSLDLSGCTAYGRIDVFSHSSLQSINVSGCTSLTSFICESSYVSSINVSGCTSLTTMDCRSNKLTTIDVSDCSKLDYLNCSGNMLTTIDVSNCPKLVYLDCRGNHIKQQIKNEDCIESFLYNCRYEYYRVWDDASQQYITKHKDNEYGWWYPGEPEKGYHGR